MSMTSPDLAAQVVADGIAASVSTSTVRRWLAEDAIKPWHPKCDFRGTVRHLYRSSSKKWAMA
jgi:hypothetical protein